MTTASTLAASIEAEARAIADRMRVYAALEPDRRIDLVHSLDVLMERLEDDWQTFVRKHNLEMKNQ